MSEQAQRAKTFRIYGASDDLVVAEGIPGCDEFGVRPGIKREDLGYAATFLLTGPGGAMRVHAFYGPGGTWFFAPAMLAEGVPIPDWPTRVTHHSIRGEVGYSTMLEIDVPDGTVLATEQVR